MNASFSTVITQDGRKVDEDFAYYPNKVIFKAGIYPNHGFEMSEAEMAQGIAKIKGTVSGDIAHSKVLAGRAVFLDNPTIDPLDSKIMRADVRIPRWLDDHLEDHERRISAEWHLKEKTFEGLSLLINPEIKEADLMATFAKQSGTPHGKAVFQRIHDHAAQAGAYCVDPPGDTVNRNASFIHRAERGLMQKIHDHSMDGGATCPGSTAYFAKKHAPTKGSKMNLFQTLARLVSGAREDVTLTDEETKALFTAIGEPAKAPEKPIEAPTADFSQNAEFVAMKARLDASEAKNAKLAHDNLVSSAKSWADGLIKEPRPRALPAERDTMVALFVQASLDDEGDGIAKFSNEAKALGASRVELLQKSYASRPQSLLYTEMVANELPAGAKEWVVIDNKASFSENTVDAKELAELRKHSHILRDADARKAKAS